MATAVLTRTDYPRSQRIDMEIDDRHGWGFALLLATTVTLFLRPADLFPRFDDWPIYQVLILCCVVVSSRALLRQFRFTALTERPVTTCLLVLLASIGISHLSHGFVWGARMSMLEFAKPLTLYLLLIALINTPRRLFAFAKIVALTIASVAGLALLDRQGIVSIAALESVRDRVSSGTEDVLMIERLRGTGIFGDPNDFGLVLVCGFVLCCAFLFRPTAGWRRYVWLLPTCLVLVAFSLTYSRGAMLAMMCVIPSLVAYRSSAKVAMTSLLVLPLLALTFSGRMTDVGAIDQGTGQSRIQIWSESLAIWRQYPMFGLGEGLLVEELNVVAHNSFIHCYAELGILGGTAFVASFLAAGLSLWSLKQRRTTYDSAIPANQEDSDLTNIRTFTFVMLVAYTAGLLTLSRQFVTPTYLVLGFATAAHQVGANDTNRWRIGNRLIATTIFASVGFLLVSYLLVRLLVRW